MILLAIDPSLTSTGVAVFVDGRLFHTKAVRIKAGKEEDIVARAYRVAEEVCDRCDPDEVVVERPEKSWRGVGTDLYGNCWVGGIIVGMLSHSDLQVRSYRTSEWSGQVPKDTTVKGAKTSPRARWIERCLEGDELRVWAQAKYNDEVDAVGIGLFYLGRLRKELKKA